MDPRNEHLERFYERAARLGQDRSVIDRDGKQVTTKMVYSLREMRDLAGPADPQQRARRQTEIDARRAGRGESLPDRIESYLYGTGDLTDREHADAQAGFPVALAVTSGPTLTLPPGETLVGPSASPTVWNYGTLRIPGDSWITVRNTYFTLHVDNLEMQAPRE